ncbi:hypothetical protein OP10G_3918 [Fimbriimonas ginsengisoli Gsoil 348]|uniref:Uncharacterized protein n=1 Tax=Fimbriimonas ginsengisoli Gsoil 348 TaxID=661478 RepID=A0A068NV05_FIMGI|nr:hypothetical protein OP10G_3918 [Fimbriimonas ginsengisoli Gsoil 348]
MYTKQLDLVLVRSDGTNASSTFTLYGYLRTPPPNLEGGGKGGR